MDSAIHADQLPELPESELELDRIELEKLDRELSESRESFYQRVVSKITEITSFSTLLRLGGAFAIISSMSLFLLQDWVAGDDVSRFYLLLAQTLLLAGGGLGLGFLLKEDKGARVFFGLGLLSICANVTTLGALVYSVVNANLAFSAMPEFARWQVAGWGDIGVSLLSAIAVSVPITLFAFRVFARGFTGTLTTYFLIATAMLLVPVRESWMSGIVIAIALLIPLHFFYTQIRGQVSSFTRENWFAVTTLFVPASIIVTRNLLWYQVDDFLKVTLASALFLVIRQAASFINAQRTVQRVLNTVSVTLAAYIAFTFGQYVSDFTMTNYFAALTASVFALLVTDVAERSTIDKKLLSTVSSFSLVAAALFQVLVIGGITSVLLCVGIGIAVVLLGKRNTSKAQLIAGVLTVLVGTGQQLFTIVSTVDFGSWISLAVIGIIAIVFASVLERYGAVLHFKWKQWLSVACTK